MKHFNLCFEITQIAALPLLRATCFLLPLTQPRLFSSSLQFCSSLFAGYSELLHLGKLLFLCASLAVMCFSLTAWLLCVHGCTQVQTAGKPVLQKCTCFFLAYSPLSLLAVLEKFCLRAVLRKGHLVSLWVQWGGVRCSLRPGPG